MSLFPRKASTGGDSSIEMMSNVHDGSHGEVDTHKEVYASPYNHYLGSPNNEPRPPVPENYPELAPHSGLEAVKADDPSKYGGVGAGAGGAAFFQKYHDDSPIPVTATPASDNLTQPPPPFPNKKPWYQNWTIRILIIAITIIIIVAIIVGAVVGSQAAKNNDDDESSDSSETATTTTTSAAPTSTSTNDEADEDDLKMGVSYNVTFTMYGTNDGSGGTNCNVRQNACGFYSDPGYAIGVSSNLFTVAATNDDSPICGTCWLLQTFEDASGNKLRRNITAIVNEECSGEPDEICGMPTLEDTNDWDMNVNINLCTDSGARDALFIEGSETGLAIGTATRVSCDDWEGTTFD